MKLQLKTPHMSIKALNATELPEFAVLIGRNGVGKTQLFEAIAGGHVAVDGIAKTEIERYDIDSFRPRALDMGSWSGSSFAQRAAEAYFLGRHGVPPSEVALDIYRGIVGQFHLHEDSLERSRFDEHLLHVIDEIPEFARFAAQRPPAAYQPAVAAYVQQIVERVVNPLHNQGSNKPQQPRHSFENDTAVLITMAMKLARKLPHDIEHRDVLRAAHYEGETISNDLNRTFVRYKVEQFAWAHARSERGDGEVSALIDRYRRENEAPWDVLRSILESIRAQVGDPELFNFTFTDPEDDRLTFADHTQYFFETELTNRSTGDRYSLWTLSSGERILMSLCLMSLNQALGRRRPRLLLLDELDATLHPSMVSTLVSRLKELFVAHGTKVVMASHSATTSAIVADDELFRIARKGGEVRIRPLQKYAAVHELSDGLVTLDTGLLLAASNAPVTVITEGNNALHLKRWAQLFFPQQVEVFDRLTASTSADQLLHYGRLLGAIRANTHFLIVWDCDARNRANNLRDKLPHGANVTPFSFEHRENRIASKGIENKYDETLLEGYAHRTTDVSTGSEVALTFASDRKLDLAKYILEHGTRRHFVHFDDLRNMVHRVLGRLDTAQ